jgi:hypothetical protein
MDRLQRDEDVQLVIDLELRLLQQQVRTSAGDWTSCCTRISLSSAPPARGGTGPRRSRRSLAGGRLPGKPITASDITGARLAGDVVHVTYVSLRDQRRWPSSIWRRAGAGWHVCFHQGTPARGGWGALAGHGAGFAVTGKARQPR